MAHLQPDHKQMLFKCSAQTNPPLTGGSSDFLGEWPFGHLGQDVTTVFLQNPLYLSQVANYVWCMA